MLLGALVRGVVGCLRFFSGIAAGIVDGSSQFIQLNGRFLACVSSALHRVKCVHDVLW